MHSGSAVVYEKVQGRHGASRTYDKASGVIAPHSGLLHFYMYAASDQHPDPVKLLHIQMTHQRWAVGMICPYTRI